jgi:tetratricopeptide (TPR) repeat protein
MKTFFCHNEIKRLSPPFDDNWMQALKNDLWNCLQYHEQKGNDIEAAFVLTDASYVATISESYAEALGYISKAIGIFEKLEQPELTAQAMFQKARLLCTWAQTGQPQFYRDAMISCQSALKVFNQESNPGLFADIHHQLGVIYSEVPDEVQKKSIWAGVSVRSFTEALNFYNKVDYPYEFGVICNNQGNAYTKYPLAVHSDNFEKAMDWYREALSVRDAQQYPNERAITLLNYLEAAWCLNLENASEENLYNEMMDKAREVLSLSVGDALKSEAQKHIVQLNELVKEKQV